MAHEATAESAAVPPRKILLATDLSCRSDRALDRAAMLARQWRAKLIVAHVIESQPIGGDPGWRRPGWLRPDDPVAAMRRRIWDDLAGDAEQLEGVDVRVATGRTADELIGIAEREGCDLIVTGVARNELLGRMIVGNTANQLVRKSRVPVLVVRERVKRPYATIAIPTDFSETSAQALLTATGLFPDAVTRLVHGHDMPRVPFAEGNGREDFSVMERERRAEFLDPLPIDPAVRDAIPLVIQHGDPERVVVEYVRDHRIDLTVVGSHGRGALFDILIGSMTSRLLENVDGDTLIVMDPRARS